MVAQQPITSQRLPPEASEGAAPVTAPILAALLLADGRFPAGGHAHSAGAEAACADGRIVDEASLACFVEGRLRTTGLVDAALAAATTLAVQACTDHDDVRAVLTALDSEAAARIAAPPLRDASRRLGRQLARVAARCWPDATVALLSATLPDGAHQPVALGTVGLAAGLGATDVAGLSVHHAVTTPAQAAVRLLGLDPFGVAAVTARLARVAADVAAEATAAAHVAVGTGRGSGRGGHTGTWGRNGLLEGIADLPALSGPLVEIGAVDHRGWDVRMFAT